MYKSLMAVICLIAMVSTVSAELEVYLPMDGNLNDYSGNGNNGVLVDGVAGTNAYASGMVGNCLDLGLVEAALPTETKMNGDYVAIDYTMPDEGTVALWYLTTDPNYSYETLWDNSVSGDNWECWIQSNGYVKFRVSDVWLTENRVEWDLDNLNGDYPDTYEGEWEHIAVTWKKLTDTTMEMSLYVNGVQRASQGAAAWSTPGDTFFLGGGNDANTYGIGAYDELGIWSNALTDAQVLDVYTNGVSVPEPTMLASLLLGVTSLFLLRRR